MEQVNWGIIGCGDVTEVKSGPAFQKVEGSSLVAVMRRDAEKASDYARRHNVPKWYDNAEALLNDSRVNAVYVATPPDTHAKYAIMAMEAGKPVYVEKPMAHNYAEALKMVKVSKQTKIPLFVAYYRRRLPGFLKVKSLVDSGAIGKVESVKIELFKAPSEAERSGKGGWRVEPAISGGGHFVDLASHQLDFLDFLFGPLSLLEAEAKSNKGYYDAEDHVTALLNAKETILVSGEWNFSSTPQNDRDLIEIIGSAGKITFSTFDFTPIEWVGEGESDRFYYPKPEHVQQPMIEEVVGLLLGRRGVKPVLKPLLSGKLSGASSPGSTAIRTSLIMEQILKNYYKHK